MTKLRVYLCHPYTSTNEDEKLQNVYRALAWLRWLVDNTTWAVGIPWLPYVQSLPEETYRERGIEDDKAMIEAHDMLVLTGDRVSAGMMAERDHAAAHGIPWMDLTPVASTPPEAGSNEYEMVRSFIDAVAPGTLLTKAGG